MLQRSPTFWFALFFYWCLLMNKTILIQLSLLLLFIVHDFLKSLLKKSLITQISWKYFSILTFRSCIILPFKFRFKNHFKFLISVWCEIKYPSPLPQFGTQFSWHHSLKRVSLHSHPAGAPWSYTKCSYVFGSIYFWAFLLNPIGLLDYFYSSTIL